MILNAEQVLGILHDVFQPGHAVIEELCVSHERLREQRDECYRGAVAQETLIQMQRGTNEDLRARLARVTAALDDEVIAGLARRLVEDLDAIERARPMAVYERDARLVGRSFLAALAAATDDSPCDAPKGADAEDDGRNDGQEPAE